MLYKKRMRIVHLTTYNQIAPKNEINRLHQKPARFISQTNRATYFLENTLYNFQPYIYKKETARYNTEQSLILFSKDFCQGR